MSELTPALPGYTAELIAQIRADLESARVWADARGVGVRLTFFPSILGWAVELDPSTGLGELRVVRST
jgi:hypothetical protein